MLPVIGRGNDLVTGERVMVIPLAKKGPIMLGVSLPFKFKLSKFYHNVQRL